MIKSINKELLLKKCKVLFSNEVLARIAIDGSVQCKRENGVIYSDYVTTHHLIELLQEISIQYFSEIIQKSVNWFKQNNSNLHNPFYLSTLTITNSFESIDEKNQIIKKILNKQKGSGLIDYFTGFTDGGLLFSTAWGIKSLTALNNENEYDNNISKALNGVKKFWEDIDNNSLKGFFLELFYQNQFGDYHSILNEIITNYDNLDFWDVNSELSLLYNTYIIGNISLFYDNLAVQKILENTITSILELDDESLKTPNKILEFKASVNDSNYTQMIIRLLISINRYLKIQYKSTELADVIIKSIINDYPSKNNTLNNTIEENNIWKKKYEQIDSKFIPFNDKLEEIWKLTPYEKTIFLIMPFKKNTNFRILTKSIREKCKALNLKVIRVDDHDRDYSPRLWDNLLINMLSAKNAIAIHVDEAAQGIFNNNEIKFFQNPNVALEFGFFTSRGQDIFLLKDIKSKLPSDLQGFKYYEFDIENSEETLPIELDNWLSKI